MIGAKALYRSAAARIPVVLRTPIWAPYNRPTDGRFAPMSPVELKCGHPRSVAGAGLLDFRRAPGHTRRFRRYELLDCLFDLFKVADSILELCFKPRSGDVLGFDPRKTIFLKFAIHSTPP
jgi:hypothetical protein